MSNVFRRAVAGLSLAATLAMAPTLAGPTQARAGMPSAESIVMLIRVSLLTLNDALLTGNFTVLRDVGAPSFREANSAARLSQNFSALIRQGSDLSAVATMTPELAETPSVDPKTNMLHIKGTFPEQPLQIEFELMFQPVAGYWRLYGISVQPKSATDAVASPKPVPKGLATESLAKTIPSTKGKEADSKK
jgi:hypothetical protein